MPQLISMVLKWTLGKLGVLLVILAILVVGQAKVKLDALERGYWWWDTYLNPAKLVELQAARGPCAARVAGRRAGSRAARCRVSTTTWRRPCEGRRTPAQRGDALVGRQQGVLEAVDEALDLESAQPLVDLALGLDPIPGDVAFAATEAALLGAQVCGLGDHPAAVVRRAARCYPRSHPRMAAPSAAAP